MAKDTKKKQTRDTANLRDRVEQIERESGATALAVAVRDVETSIEFDYESDRWFHAASTIKIPILVGVFGAVHAGELLPQSRLHVRNRFRSADDDSIFRVDPERDANAVVHAAIGKTMQVRELAFHMIATSSNLATNLLLDFVGLQSMQRTLADLGFDDGIELHRGVEDNRAFDAGISNRVTAAGLARMLKLIAEERAFSRMLSKEMLDILHAQEFNSGIPAPLPKRTRVAHKTGEISTIAHDAGIVYLPGRNPYVLVVLTEWEPDGSGRQQAIARVSEAVYEFLADEGGSKKDG
ncbi:MAG: class A beta-lactamase-related serine hydrolase [Gemmatimonadaceae bacterium]|nr:class A beta-lactamase-related serine hydrolase [Gemmatimonadaceae bacterium]